MSARLFFQIAFLEARARMSYRVDFWLNAVVSFVVQFLIVYFLWTSMYRESGKTEIGGYDLDGMLLYYVAVILCVRVVRGTDLQGAVSSDIYEGGLNRYLVFPAAYFPFKYAQALGGLVPTLIQLVLLGSVFPFVFSGTGTAAVSPATVLMSLASLLVANLLYFTLSFPLQAVAFWADNVWSLGVALRFVTGLLGGSLLPLSVFPQESQAVLAWLPFRYLFDQPVNVLLGRVGFAAWIQGVVLCLLWAALIGLVGRLVWRRGTLQYSGVGI